jgi:hypothetical protein
MNPFSGEHVHRATILITSPWNTSNTITVDLKGPSKRASPP